MKLNTKNKNPRLQASVLVVALVISAIGTIGVLATVSIIGARAHHADASLDGLTNRIVLSNSKALAREVIYRNYLGSGTLLNAEQEFKWDGWAVARIGEIDDSPLAFADAARTHPTGAAPSRAFSKDVSVKLSDSKTEHVLQYQMRSYNPALGGDLLSIHPTMETADEAVKIFGDLDVKGRAVFWEAIYHQNTTSTVRSEALVMPAAVKKIIQEHPDGTAITTPAGQLPPTNLPTLVMENPDDEDIKPLNFIEFSQTMGPSSGGSYGGHLDIVDNGATGVNSYFTRLNSLGGAVTIAGGAGDTDGLGVDTVPPKVNDATLINLIDTEPNEATVVGQLAASSPLSSAVMMAALNRVPAISDAYLLPLLNSQAPLPDDVMIMLGDPTTSVVESTRNTLLKNTGFSYLCDGKGTVTVNLESIYLPNLNLADVTRINLEGQYDGTSADAAKLLQPRAIAIKNPENVFLSHVNLKGLTNQRRIALAISQTGVLDGLDLIDTQGANSTLGTYQTQFDFVGASPFAQWKLILETEGVSQNWDISGLSTATLVGGIRADHSIRINSGTLILDQETDTEFIESLVSRNAWIETYK